MKVHAPSVQEPAGTLDRFVVDGQAVTSVAVPTPVLPRALALPPGRPRKLSYPSPSVLSVIDREGEL